MPISTVATFSRVPDRNTGRQPGPMPLRYLPLGDSYTIGTSVGAAERWPDQLVARMPDRLVLVGNLAVNGYTSADLVREELPVVPRIEPDLVSVLIGVNDVVRGVGEETYARNVAHLLDALGERLPARRIFAVATPDYTLTPRGAAYGAPDARRAGIVRVNARLEAACAARGIAFVGDIFAISCRVTADPALVAADGLHPSGAQYAQWVAAIEPVVRDLLS